MQEPGAKFDLTASLTIRHLPHTQKMWIHSPSETLYLGAFFNLQDVGDVYQHFGGRKSKLKQALDRPGMTSELFLLTIYCGQAKGSRTCIRRPGTT